MSTNSNPKPAKLSESQFLAAGVAVFLLITACEALTHQGTWNWLVLLPLAIGVYFLETKLDLPLLSKPLHCCHGVFLGTFICLGPSSAVLVAALSLTAGLAKTWWRCQSKVTGEIVEYLPSLVALWIAGKIYPAMTLLSSPSWLHLSLPVVLATTLYCLFYVALRVASAWVMRDAPFAEEFRQNCLEPLLLFLSVAVSAGLLSYFSFRIGKSIYLLAIPFALFVLTTYKMYSVKLENSSRRLSELSRLQTSIVETLALAIDAKDHSTRGHARRVEVYAVGIAKSLGIDNPDELEALSTASLFHDIGKLAIPEHILSKPGRLTDSEFTKMKSHVEIGANILEPVPFPYPVVPIIRYHHERLDGSGYPYGLTGEHIPLGSKILAVADAFDALTAQRAYRSVLRVPDAIDRISAESGLSFDPAVVQAFLKVAPALIEQVEALEVNKPGETIQLLGTPGARQEHKLWLRREGFKEIASAQREIYALHEIFQTVGKSLNLEDTLRIFLTKLQSVVPFTTGAVYLKNKKNDAIHPAMVTGEYEGQLHKNWVKLGEGLTGYAIAFNQPIVNRDPAMDFCNLADLERPHRLANAMIFPLRAKDAVLGAIALYSTDKDKEAFTEDHVRLMETLSERAAISIQNAQSFEYYEENSLTDPLTGLPNSRYMLMAFEQNVKKAERTKERMAVLVMDLNGFKQINDQYGHKVGDEVLMKVAEILQKEMRRYDTCIRYAGDEFVAFLYDAERETAERIVARIRQAVHALVLRVQSGKEVRLGISVGLSMYPEDGAELTQLFTVADSQMYNDKFETKAELARQARASLKDAVEVEGDIQFRRAN